MGAKRRGGLNRAVLIFLLLTEDLGIVASLGLTNAPSTSTKFMCHLGGHGSGTITYVDDCALCYFTSTRISLSITMYHHCPYNNNHPTEGGRCVSSCGECPIAQFSCEGSKLQNNLDKTSSSVVNVTADGAYCLPYCAMSDNLADSSTHRCIGSPVGCPSKNECVGKSVDPVCAACVGYTHSPHGWVSPYEAIQDAKVLVCKSDDEIDEFRGKTCAKIMDLYQTTLLTGHAFVSFFHAIFTYTLKNIDQNSKSYKLLVSNRLALSQTINGGLIGFIVANTRARMQMWAKLACVDSEDPQHFYVQMMVDNRNGGKLYAGRAISDPTFLIHICAVFILILTVQYVGAETTRIATRTLSEGLLRKFQETVHKSEAATRELCCPIRHNVARNTAFCRDMVTHANFKGQFFDTWAGKARNKKQAARDGKDPETTGVPSDLEERRYLPSHPPVRLQGSLRVRDWASSGCYARTEEWLWDSLFDRMIELKVIGLQSHWQGKILEQCDEAYINTIGDSRMILTQAMYVFSSLGIIFSSAFITMSYNEKLMGHLQTVKTAMPLVVAFFVCAYLLVIYIWTRIIPKIGREDEVDMEQFEKTCLFPKYVTFEGGEYHRNRLPKSWSGDAETHSMCGMWAECMQCTRNHTCVKHAGEASYNLHRVATCWLLADQVAHAQANPLKLWENLFEEIDVVKDTDIVGEVSIAQTRKELENIAETGRKQDKEEVKYLQEHLDHYGNWINKKDWTDLVQKADQSGMLPDLPDLAYLRNQMKDNAQLRAENFQATEADEKPDSKAWWSKLAQAPSFANLAFKPNRNA